MAEKDFELYLKQLLKDFEQKSEFNQVPEVLEERANYLRSILLEFTESKVELWQKHNIPIPSALSELDEEKLILTFKELLNTQNPPLNAEDIFYQLSVLFIFYKIFSDLKILPPLYLLLKVDNLAMQAMYFAGLYISMEPFHASNFVRLHSSKTRISEKKAIVGKIIEKAAKEKKIPFGKVTRPQQFKIRKEIKKMICENELTEEQLSCLKNNKPPSIDTIMKRMEDAAIAEN